jgi:regulation of enolase protein 1 (concanavalin A-like superfamily)
MRESNTRMSKAKKLQTVTMKRRARKLKSIEALPTKARNPQARACRFSASAVWHVGPAAASPRHN